MEWGGILGVLWAPAESWEVLHLKVLWWRRQIQLGQTPSEKDEQPRTATTPAEKRKGSKGKRLSVKLLLKLLQRVVRTFQVRHCRITWDSGNFVWNAWAYPIARLLDTRVNGTVGINFVGRQEVHLVLENRLGRIVWAVSKTLIFKH